MNGLCGPHCKKPLTKITQSKGQYNTGYRFGIVLSHYLMSEVKPCLYCKAKPIVNSWFSRSWPW